MLDLAQLDGQRRGGLVAERVLQSVDLDVRQRPVHGAVRDAVAVRRLARFWIGKGVDVLDALVELVLDVGLGAPERDVLEDRRVFAVGLERRYRTLFELLVEALVVRPEQSDVRDGKEDHGVDVQAPGVYTMEKS